MNKSNLLNPRLVISKLCRNKSKSTGEYCLDYVRQYDYENFICTLLLNHEERIVAFAVRGFNVEISRIGEQISQETTGLMRLQFWDDTIDKCYSKDIMKVPKHPVALELYKAISSQQLTKRYLKNLIKCRRDNLKLNVFPNIEASEKYAELSVSNVYYVILEGCGVKNVNADHAASHLGKAQGLVQQLRSTPLCKKMNFISFPQDILNKNKVSHEEILRNIPSERLNECTYEVSSRAYQHLTKARNLLETVPSQARKVLLPAIPIEHYLMKLQKVNYDVLHPKLQQPSRMWMPKLWFKSIKNQY